jgi:flagellar basal-body rod modification protein FlgD
MSISALSGTSNTTTTTSSSKSNTMVSKDDFLKILVSQLKYQDPLEPMKADQFLTQLSQLTQVEQLQNISDSLASMKTASETGNMMQWINTIGRKVNVDSTTLSKGDQVYLTPSGDYDQVVLTLTSQTDGSTNKVTFNKGDALAYTYDGTDIVTMSATATKNNKSVACTTSAYRVVAGIDTSSGTPLIVAGSGETYSTSKVKQIY